MRHCARWPAAIGSRRPEPLEPVTPEPRVPWPMHRNPRISKKLWDTEPQVPLEPLKLTMWTEKTDAGLTADDRAAEITRRRETAPLYSRGPHPEPPDPAPPVPLLHEPGGSEQRQDDAATLVAGLHVAACGMQPSWADAAALPSRGCLCTCCKGQRWWRERAAPKGWRCSTCHPPDHLPPDAVTEMRT